MSENRQIHIFFVSSCATLNETFTALWRFPQNTISEIKIRNLHPKAVMMTFLPGELFSRCCKYMMMAVTVMHVVTL